MTFKDGSSINMVTNESNMLHSGGPWQTTIDGQDYMQREAQFLTAMLDIQEALELPYGWVKSYGCGTYRDPMNIAFGGEPVG